MIRVRRLNEAQGQRRMVNGKPAIDYEQAVRMLYEKLNRFDPGDDIYGLVTDIFHRFRDEIEEKYTVIDYEGYPIDSSSNEDEMWYDDEFNDFYTNCCAKLKRRM